MGDLKCTWLSLCFVRSTCCFIWFWPPTASKQRLLCWLSSSAAEACGDFSWAIFFKLPFLKPVSTTATEELGKKPKQSPPKNTHTHISNKWTNTCTCTRANMESWISTIKGHTQAPHESLINTQGYKNNIKTHTYKNGSVRNHKNKSPGCPAEGGKKPFQST